MLQLAGTQAEDPSVDNTVSPMTTALRVCWQSVCNMPAHLCVAELSVMRPGSHRHSLLEGQCHAPLYGNTNI